MEQFLTLALMVTLAAATLASFILWKRGRTLSELRTQFNSLQAHYNESQRMLAVAQVGADRSLELEEKLASREMRIDDLQVESATAKAQVGSAQAECTDLRGRLAEIESEKSNAFARVEALQSEKACLEADLAALRESLAQERKQATEKLDLLREARDDLTKEFKVLASAVMREHGETFAKQNKEQIEVVLSPLRDKLTDFQQGLTAAHNETIKERAALGEQIKQLSITSATMTSETSNLTRALKGKAHTQGAWGEMILTTILEKSGLRLGHEYEAQKSQITDEGQRLRPDVVVYLPGGQRIVIDAKVSLTAFESHINAESEEDRVLQLHQHLTSMRNHIRTLGDKSYQVHTNGGVDYVIMFVPIEGALAAALQEEPDLTSEAIARNVNIATPTTLMVALRTAASVWQVERRNLNAEAIAARAGALYDKFVAFVADMEGLGTKLNQANVVYNDALGKLSRGTGNLVRQTEMLKDLGAKATKALPAIMVEASTKVEASGSELLLPTPTASD